jgi:hypothetical protein
MAGLHRRLDEMRKGVGERWAQHITAALGNLKVADRGCGARREADAESTCAGTPLSGGDFVQTLSCERNVQMTSDDSLIQ